VDRGVGAGEVRPRTTGAGAWQRAHSSRMRLFHRSRAIRKLLNQFFRAEHKPTGRWQVLRGEMRERRLGTSLRNASTESFSAAMIASIIATDRGLQASDQAPSDFESWTAGSSPRGPRASAEIDQPTPASRRRPSRASPLAAHRSTAPRAASSPSRWDCRAALESCHRGRSRTTIPLVPLMLTDKLAT